MFKTVNRTTMGDEVLEQFIEMLGSGRYKPGDRLPAEKAMCEELSVSRPVLREVIRALRYMGYLEAVQGGGTYVCNKPFSDAYSKIKVRLALSNTHLMQLWEIRNVLEVEAAGLAAERATEAEILEIHKAFEAYKNNIDNENSNARTVQLSFRFHSLIAEATHNEMLVDMLGSIADMLTRAREKSIQVEGSNTRAVNYHRQLSEAIASRNVKRAKSAMKSHLLDVKCDLIAYLEQKGEDIEV